MPSSEPEKEPVRLTRRWWAGLGAGLAILGGYALVNVAVDPTGEFGQSGRHAFNRSPPPGVIAQGEAGGNPAFFTRAIREHRGDIFLIGSSRTWRGFDTCSRPEILRVAGSAWGSRELTRVERAILKSRTTPATVLIEVGLPTRERPAIVDPAQAALSTALSPRTALQSLQTVTHSLTGGEADPPTYAPCQALAPAPQDWTQADRSLRYTLGQLDTSAASLATGRRTLADMVDQADDVCRRTGLRHRLVFFTLPATPDAAPVRGHDRLVQVNAARIAAMFADRNPGEGGCDIRYLNFASTPPGDPEAQALWRDRDQWSDYFHFSTRLGETALKALLSPRP
jgi:hypothetical protein